MGKKQKIGVVLGQYPVPSETFIRSFLGHLDAYDVVLFARLTDINALQNNWRSKPWLNRLPPWYQMFAFLGSWLAIGWYWRRLLVLRNKKLSIKQIIADANIWTTPRLDILHFPFAAQAFGREHYAQLLGARMTLSFRGSDINVYPIFHQRSYVSLWAKVDKVHCNARELAEKLKAHGIPENMPVRIIHPALRKELADTDFKRMSNPGILRILTIGRLHWIKDYPLALRTMATLKKAGITFTYTIIGEGPDREQLMFLIHALELEDCVHLLGTQGAAAIRSELESSDIYLQTSLEEGFSNACLEAQAFGLPCVVPAISGMEAAIEDGQTGIIVRERSPEAFSSAILTLHGLSPEEKAIRAAYMAHRVREQFSLEQQKQAWGVFFNEVSNNH